MVVEWFSNLQPVYQALLATLFTWGMTGTGAGVVFFFKEFNQKVMDFSLGFAAGVMIAASYWSLLAPAIEMAELTGTTPWIPAAIGFLLGGIFLRGIDAVLPHLHPRLSEENAEGIETSWRKSTLLVLAITIHNIPEGLAIGVAFGAVVVGIESATLPGAIALAVGIGIQNFPEGTAVSIPLRREGLTRLKSFWYGQLSGAVEPIAAVIGVITTLTIRSMLPYALSFAAGAMIFVVIEELIPESQLEGNTDLATLGVMIGFTIMMILDVALG